MGAEAAVTQLRRGAVEHCVLALLEDDERYGYDLVQQLTAAGLVASEGTVYPLLSRLRKDELVATVWRDSPTRAAAPLLRADPARPARPRRLPGRPGPSSARPSSRSSDRPDHRHGSDTRETP